MAASTRPPVQRSTSRRAELFDAVIESVGIHGFERASLRDIASRAGMTHAGLLTHFGSKDQLLVAALDGVEAREREAMAEIIASGATDREVMEAMIELYTQDPDRSRYWFTLMIAASDPQHPAHEYFQVRHQRFRDQVEQFAALPDTANVGLFDVETRATLYMAMLDGLRLEWLISPATDVKSAAGRFADLILRTRTGANASL